MKKSITFPNEDTSFHPIPIKLQKFSINFLTEQEGKSGLIMVDKNISNNSKNERFDFRKSLENYKLCYKNKSINTILYDICLVAKSIFAHKFIWKEIFFPNTFTFILIIILINIQFYVHQHYLCELDLSNLLVVLYIILRETFVDLFFYFLTLYYVVTSLINSEAKLLFWLMILNTCFLMALKIYKIHPIEQFYDIHILNWVICIIFYFIYYKKNKTTSNHIIKNFFITILVVIFPFFLNYYVMKGLVIPQVNKITNEIYKGKIVFQIFIFVYFKLYGIVLFEAIVKYVCFAEYHYKNSEKFVVLLSKYYILDVVISAFPAAILEDINSLEAWLGIFNFIYQIFVLYDKNHNTMYYLKCLVLKICKKKIDDKPQTIIQIKANEILTFALNEMLIIIFLRTVLFISFNSVLTSSGLIKITCNYLITEKKFLIKIENFIIIIFINICLVIILLRRETNPLKFVWNLESFNPFAQVYILLAFYAIADSQFQYYFSLYFNFIKNVT